MANIPFICGSDIKENPVFYSKYSKYKILFSDYLTTDFIEELITFGKSSNTRSVFISDDDRAILSFSKHRDKLQNYFHFNLPEHKIVDDLLNKKRFSLIADKFHLPVPITFIPENCNDIDAIACKINYPCVIKPSYRELWWVPEFKKVFGAYTKVIHCNNKSELLSNYDKIKNVNPDVIIQESVVGPDSQLFSVNMYINKNGELLGIYAAQHKSIYPIHGGVGSLVETVDAPHLIKLSIEIAHKLNIIGFFNIQYKKDIRTNELKILEVQFRNSMWCSLGAQSGANVIAIGYYDMVGLEYPYSKQARAGVKYIDIIRDLLALKDYWKNGELTLLEWLNTRRGEVTYAIVSWKDPLPLITNLWFSFKNSLGKRNEK
ncbi:MAG: hypothetical protein QME58_13235 [Bacteroidota bacterium]|nr:hypothetical protein [Bacteroidota bacterium]